MRLTYVDAEAYHAVDGLSPGDRLRAYATLSRLNALYMIKRAGSGHIGSSFSVMDIVTLLALNRPEAVVFSSKGHDAPAFYATMMATGKLPFDLLHKLRRPGGLPGHPEVTTPGIPVNSGSLGMGISKAKGIIRANRLRGVTQQVYVILGDGELQEGQIWESLAGAAREKMHELTAIVDANGYQSDRATADTGGIRLLNVSRMFEAAGWSAFAIDGNEFGGIASMVTTETDRPTVVIAETVKGNGVAFMEHADDDGFYRYHSGAPNDRDYYDALHILKTEAARYIPELTNMLRTVEHQPEPRDTLGKELVAAYSEALLAEAAAEPRLVVFDADLAVDHGLVPFQRTYPDRFVECGIAEQDMVSQAGAMALGGALPVVHSFAAFLTRRANEQIYDNCCQGSRVIYVGSLAGVLPWGPGPTHEALNDVALMRTMPGMTILEPLTPDEVRRAVRYAVRECEGPVYIRLIANSAELARAT